MNREELSSKVREYWCGDDRALREIACSYNMGTGDVARALLAQGGFIDACAFHLRNYNWMLQEAGPGCLCMDILEAGDTSVNGAMLQMASYLAAIRKDPEHFVNVREVSDLDTAAASGKIGIILSAQTCDFISYKCIEEYTELFARMGLRLMGLAYNHRTFAADGCKTGTDAGLSAQGKALVHAMNRCGVTIDLAHVGRASCMDAIENSEMPVIYSHSNPESIFPGPRSVSDREIRACAQKGGVICVTGYAPTLYDGNRAPTIDRFVDAVDYLVDYVGIEHVGVGLDAMGQPGMFSQEDADMLCGRVRSGHIDAMPYIKSAEEGYGDASVATIGLYGIANHVNIIEQLLRRGYSEEDVQKIIGGNLRRVFEKTWAGR